MKNKKSIVWLVTLAVAMLAAAGGSFAATSTSIADPLQIAIGARPLGMGGAYVAVAEDAETLFVNPAGLGGIKSAKFTSMYTSLMGDVNYIVLGGVYPYAGGAVGLGVASAGLSELQLYDGSGTSLGTGSYSENVIVASYGKNIENLYGLENVKVGGSLKYFMSSGSGASMEGASGSGFDVDLGVLYSPKSWLTFGANFENALPTGFLGGVIVHQTGEEDAIESVAKIGTRIDVLGNKDALNVSNYKLSLNGDIDFNLQSGYGLDSHLGAEFWPVEALALRVGLDSDSSAAGVTSNLTAGLGVRYGGVEFNYAYHPYDSISEDTTHYFSLSYVGEEIAVVAPPGVSIISPEDKFVTNDEFVKVIGIVENVKAADLKTLSVTVNGLNAPVDSTGKFEVNYPIEKLGKKLLVVEVKNEKGMVANAERRILRLASFVDVGKGYWAKDPIEHTSTVGLIQGYPDGTFRPDRALTRAELATLLVRAMGIETQKVSGKPFKDISKDNWAVEYIAAAKKVGYMAGYPDGTFKPNKRITKVEGITVMARLDKLPLQPYVQAPYSDIPGKHWAAKYVQAAKEAGLLSYLKTSDLKPKTELTRAESVEMLSKTKFAGVKIKELLSWFVGFKEEKKGGATTTTSRVEEMGTLLSAK